MQEYLIADEIIDFNNPQVFAKAKELSSGLSSDEDIAKACFLFVRDEIRHVNDAKDNIITCTASEVLEHKTGWCYAKSHLLCALLRANSIPSGLAYQRLSFNDDGAPYCLHGLNFVYLQKYDWYRIDARGNKAGVDAQFMPPVEKLAFNLMFEGEEDCKVIYAKPLPIIVEFLQKYKTLEISIENLPDCKLS